MANAGTGPDVATRIPPSAGPSTVPTCTAAELIAFPACRLSAGSSDGMIANEAGMNSPSPAPSRAATGASQASVARCRAASTVSATASRQRATSAPSIRRRGPILSASTPPSGISAVRGTP